VISELTRGRANLSPQELVSDERLDFSCYAEPPPHDEPWPWLSAAQTELDLADAAARVGARTLLTGQGSDELNDTGPYHITDLIRRGRIRAAYREVAQSAAAENAGFWTIAVPFGLVPLLPAWLHQGWPRSPRDMRGMSRTSVAPWIAADFAHRFGVREILMNRARELYSACRPTVLSVALSSIRNRAGDLGRWYLGLPRGILTTHPFLDPRLISFSLGIHSRFSPPPRGSPKPLLAAAMRGVLPDEIRLRHKAGYFNEPVYRGLARHLPELKRLVCDSPLDELSFIDREKLTECLEQAALGIGATRAGLDRLNITLAILRWLSLRAERPANLSKPAQILTFPWTVTEAGELSGDTQVENLK
jgi:asparagine synthase (glutamine-hydrolysing)